MKQQLFDPEEQIIQIMPITSADSDYTAIIYDEPADPCYPEDGTLPIYYHVEGLALTNKGNIHPILFDGHLSVRIYDERLGLLAVLGNAVTRRLEKQRYNISRDILLAFRDNKIDFEEAKEKVSNLLGGEECEKALRSLSVINDLHERQKEQEAEADLPFDD